MLESVAQNLRFGETGSSDTKRLFLQGGTFSYISGDKCKWFEISLANFNQIRLENLSSTCWSEIQNKRCVQRGLSNVEYSAMGLPANVLRRNNEYVLCWQQQHEFNEEVEDEVRSCQS